MFIAKKLYLFSIVIILFTACHAMEQQHPNKSWYFDKGAYKQADEDLYTSIVNHNTEAMMKALNNGADPLRAQRGNTLLHFLAGNKPLIYKDRSRSISGGHWMLEAMQILLENGADPLALNDEGLTPLQLLEKFKTTVTSNSPYRKTIQSMEELLKNAAHKKREEARQQLSSLQRPHEFSYQGLLPSPVRTMVGKYIVGPIAQELAQIDKLFAAIKAGNPTAINQLLAEGVDPEARSEAGTPALFLAALLRDPQRSEEVVRLLLPHVNNLNPANARGMLLLDVLRGVPDRQNVVALIEQAMRERGQIISIVPQVQRKGWFGGLFGIGKG